MSKRILIGLGVCAAALAAVTGLSAAKADQAPAVKRTVLLKQDMEIPGREATMALVELPPGGAEGRHTHPAEVYVFVLEGTLSLEIEGKPTVTVKAGDVFNVPYGKIHQATNVGTTTAKAAAVFVAEKGKPLTTPAK